MALTCPRCGRDYDVTLFEFGHTVTCIRGKVITYEEGHRLLLAKERKRAPPSRADKDQTQDNG